MAAPSEEIQHNFDLLIVRLDREHYKAIVIEATDGDADEDFKLQSTDLEDLKDKFQGIEQVRRASRGSSIPECANASDFGAQLFNSIFFGSVRDCLNACRGAAREAGASLRIRLRMTGVPELVSLPWELMFDRYRKHFLALDGKTTLVRYLPVGVPIQSMRVAPPLRVLVAVSKAGGPALDVVQELKNLEAAMAGLKAAGMVQVTHTSGGTFEDLGSALEADQFHVLHFIGHGAFNSSTGEGQLAFEDGLTGDRMVNAGKFASLLNGRGLRLVVLNTCEGGRASREDSFGGVAQALVRSAIPAVVAMQLPVSDEAAIEFSKSFYRFLAKGQPVDLALGACRRRLSESGRGGDIEWATPVLYMRGDGRLFEAGDFAMRGAGPGTPEETPEPPSSGPLPGQTYKGMSKIIFNQLSRIGAEPNVIADIVARYRRAKSWDSDPFDGFAPNEVEGYKLTAAVASRRTSKYGYPVDTTIQRVDGKEFSASIALLLHNTFDEPVWTEHAKARKYKERFHCEEGFVVAALVVPDDSGRTIQLALDLCQLPGAPSDFVAD